MSPRLTKMLMAAALAVSTFAGSAIAQPSGGPGPNAASSEPNPTNSLPYRGATGQTNPMPNDGRIVLQPQPAEPAPMMGTQHRMGRHHDRHHRRHMNRHPSTMDSSPSSMPSSGVAPNSTAR